MTVNEMSTFLSKLSAEKKRPAGLWSDLPEDVRLRELSLEDEVPPLPKRARVKQCPRIIQTGGKAPKPYKKPTSMVKPLCQKQLVFEEDTTLSWPISYSWKVSDGGFRYLGPDYDWNTPLPFENDPKTIWIHDEDDWL